MKIIALLIINIVIFVGMFILFNTAIDQAKKQYLKPDTTISIHNGIPDTVIVKKQIPWWAK